MIMFFPKVDTERTHVYIWIDICNMRYSYLCRMDWVAWCDGWTLINKLACAGIHFVSHPVSPCIICSVEKLSSFCWVPNSNLHFPRAFFMAVVDVDGFVVVFFVFSMLVFLFWNMFVGGQPIIRCLCVRSVSYLDQYLHFRPFTNYWTGDAAILIPWRYLLRW